MNRNPHNLPDELTVKNADELVDMAYPDLQAFITRADLARMFARDESRSVNEGLRHFAKQFLPEAKHVALIGMLKEMSSSRFPESYIAIGVGIREKAKKIARTKLGAAR